MKRVLDRDAAEFYPDALVIRNEVLPWWARSAMIWMGCFFLIVLAWAYFGHVEVIVSAQGRIISASSTIVMKPLDRTVIREVCVRVGERVREGQVLVSFDPVFSRADKERFGAEVKSYEARLKRLSAECSGNVYEPSSPPQEVEMGQLSIFQQRRSLYNEKMTYFASELQKLEKKREARKENLELQRKRLITYKDIEKMHREGVNSRFVSLLNLRQVELSRLQVEADIKDGENDLLVIESEIQAKMAERDAFRKQWELDVSEEMVKTGDMLIQARKEYDKALQRTSYVALRAPEDAIVHDIVPLAPGSAVREAEELVTLVPLGGDLEVEAEIHADDIGKVKEGDSVRVKVSAFPFQKYGTLTGTIRVLSKDSFHRESNMFGQDESFYRARIAIAYHEENGYKRMGRLIPGMETVNEIRVGERRILEYLTDPIIKSLDESIREP